MQYIKKELIYKRLKLEDIGIDLTEIKNDTQIFAADDLGLDSVDGLEIAIGIQQKFQIKLPLESNASMTKHFYTPITITDYIIELLKKQKGWQE
ncbi:MAG: acyl carrier protein [Bacteroidetes bacterium]|nr:acyl carrier protein [Bacteroidota bacterium]